MSGRHAAVDGMRQIGERLKGQALKSLKSLKALYFALYCTRLAPGSKALGGFL